MIVTKHPHAYLAGALLGDAWISTGSGKSPGGYLCLRVADAEFAAEFAAAIEAGFGVVTAPRLDERGYWLTRTYNGHGRFDGLLDYRAANDGERAAWLRGLFDSEGNARLARKPRGERSWDRRVAMYSTILDTLTRAGEYLSALGILTHTNAYGSPDAPGHKGSKQVYELRVRASREAFVRFADLVGSSIGRKRDVLTAIPGTYVKDTSAARREQQSRGAATRSARTAERLPDVLAAIREIAATEQPTQQVMSARIPGYWAQHKRHGGTSGLLALAFGIEL